jgi:hypothetical protein
MTPGMRGHIAPTGWLDRKGSAFQLTNMQVDDNCQDDQDRFDKT